MDRSTYLCNHNDSCDICDSSGSSGSSDSSDRSELTLFSPVNFFFTKKMFLPKYSKCDKTQKFKMLQNSKT